MTTQYEGEKPGIHVMTEHTVRAGDRTAVLSPVSAVTDTAALAVRRFTW
jgi:hypothetical protein